MAAIPGFVMRTVLSATLLVVAVGGAAAGQRRRWRQMSLADWHGPDRAVAAQGGKPFHRDARRAGEESQRAHRRLQCGEAGFLRAVGPAGPEEVLYARHFQGRRGPD